MSSETSARKVAVIVAGSWGTALAHVLAINGHKVMLWSRNEEQVDEIRRTRMNSKYLSDIRLHEGVQATTSLEEALRNASAVVLAAPSAAMREVAARVSAFIEAEALVVHAAKGFETDSLKRMSTVLREELPAHLHRICVISGPSHAEEVVRRLPTTVVVASESRSAAKEAQDLFMNSFFRVYTNSDLVGVEVSGALKNIIAISAGISDGLGFGDNARAALITRGLAEIGRLGTEMGADPLTFAGLAGTGDLVVTCTSRHSRNWRAGHLLAQGFTVEQVQKELGMVVEGIRTTKAAYQLSVRHGVEMPITCELYQVLFRGKSPKQAVEDLMNRVRTQEMEQLLSGHTYKMD